MKQFKRLDVEELRKAKQPALKIVLEVIEKEKRKKGGSDWNDHHDWTDWADYFG